MKGNEPTRDPREKTVVLHNRKGCLGRSVSVIPQEPQGMIHIYLGANGYKLSIGERHLTLAELVYVVDKMNAIYMYGG